MSHSSNAYSDLTSTLLAQNGLVTMPTQFACQFPGAVSMVGGAELLQKDQQAALMWQSAPGDEKQQQQVSQAAAGQSAAGAAAAAAAQQQHLEFVQNLGQQYVLNNGYASWIAVSGMTKWA